MDVFLAAVFLGLTSSIAFALMLFITSMGLSDFDIFTPTAVAILLRFAVIEDGAPPFSTDCSNSTTSSSIVGALAFGSVFFFVVVVFFAAFFLAAAAFLAAASFFFLFASISLSNSFSAFS